MKILDLKRVFIHVKLRTKWLYKSGGHTGLVQQTIWGILFLREAKYFKKNKTGIHVYLSRCKLCYLLQCVV